MAALYVHEAGDSGAPPIVFLHGGGLSGRMWQPQMEALIDFRCLAPDLPEHGQNSSAEPFTLSGAAAAVVHLIRESTPQQKAHIVGLSIGGAVGLEILRTAPEVVNRAVLSGPTPQLGRILVAITDAINGPLLRLLPRKQLIGMTLKSLNVPDAFRPLMEADLQQLTPELYRHINQATGAVLIPTQAVPPTLVVVGEKEPGVSRRHAQKLGREAPGVTARLVPGVGHAWNLEAPELFNATVRAWLIEAPLPQPLLELQ